MMGPGNGKPLLLPLCAFLLAVGVGYLVGGRREGATPVSVKTEAYPIRADLPPAAIQALAPVMATTSANDRQRAAIALAREIPVAALGDWLDGNWYPFADGLDRMLFDSILRERWFTEDPAGLASHCLLGKSNDLNEVIRQWAGRDPEAVIAWLWQIKDSQALARVSLTCFDRIVLDKPLLALEQMPVIHERLGESASWWLGGMLTTISRTHRDAVISKMPSWPPSLREEAQNAVRIEEAEDNFPAIIGKMKSEQDGIEQFVAAISSPRFAGKVLENAAMVPKGWIAAAALSESSSLMVETDPKFWLDIDFESLGLSEAMASKLRDFGMSGLIDRNPEQAIKLLKRDNLRPDDRRQILSNGFLRLATKDPARARECLAELTDPKELARAENTVKNSGPPAPKAPMKLTPREWIAGFANGRGLPRNQVKSSLEWNPETIAILREEFTRLSDEEKSVVSMGSVMLDSGVMGSYRGDSSALTWLRADGIAHYLKHPPKRPLGMMPDSRAVDTLIMKFAVRWALEDPASASRWAQEDLPLGPQRLAILKHVADYWLKDQPIAASEWIRSLPVGEMEQIHAYLKID